MKDKKISNGRLITIILMLLVIIIGGTFAWFTYQSNKSALVLSIGDLNDSRVTIKPYQIRDTMMPVNVYSSGVYSQVDAINENSGKMNMELFYKVNNISNDLINNGLKYTIVSSNTKNGTYNEVITGDFTTIDNNEIIIYDTQIDGNTTIYYRVYLWLDSSVGDQTILQNSSLDVELNASISRDGFTIIYNANGGSGAPDSQTKIPGTNLTLSNTIPTKFGYVFLGWSISDSATTATYNAGETFTTDADTTLYAVWLSSSPVLSYSCANGSAGNSPYLFTYSSDCTVIDDNDGNWRVKFLETGTFRAVADMVVDVFAVGGGANGTKGESGGTYDSLSGGNGGGGGYTNTVKHVSIAANTDYVITIGGAGAETSAFNVKAAGGSGVAGGSGAGKGGTYNVSATSGAYDGNSSYGAGQGTTTREFGEPDGDFYGGGGGGGAGSYGTTYGNAGGGSAGGGGAGGYKGAGQNGTANTGGGGGGGSSALSYGYSAGTGGSGIAIIRNDRSLVNVDTITLYSRGDQYTGRTGGWIEGDYNNRNTTVYFKTTFSKLSDYLKWYSATGWYTTNIGDYMPHWGRGSFWSSNKIDLTDYNTLEFKYTSSLEGDTSMITPYMVVSNYQYFDLSIGLSAYTKYTTLNKNSSTEITTTLDISDVTGSYYVGLVTNSNGYEPWATQTLNVYEIKLYK